MQITQAFSREVPKAVAGYADSQTRPYTTAANARDAARAQLETESDPARRMQLEQNVARAEQAMADNRQAYDNWKEGGSYRVALHTAAGALGGGINGAMGAAASASAAPRMDDLQSRTVQVLQDAGMDAGTAKAVAQGVASLTAAGIGAAVGGGQGAGTAMAVDANNRQLHPDETKWIEKNAKRFAQQMNGGQEPTAEQIAAAEQRLAQQAFRQVQFGAEGTDDAQARAFLSQAHGMLTADPNCPTCGLGYMFYATPEQRANTGMYAGTLGQTSGFYQANGLTQPTLQQIVNAAATDGAQRNAVAQRTVLAAMAAGTLTLAPALSGLAAEAAAFAKNPVGYCLGNPAACTVAAETAAYTAAGVPQPTSVVPTSRTGTVWDSIKATQPTYPGTVIPRSFEMALPNGERVWVAGNATEHLVELANRTAVNYTPEAVRLATQLNLSELQGAINVATQNGVRYGELITVGRWELKFAPPRVAGQLPALIHAQPK